MSGARGVPFVVSGPSGSGKSTLLRRLLEREGERVRFSVSHTTRPPRAGEVDGRDYWFVDEPRFRELIDAGCFLEWARYGGNLYGTSREAVTGPTESGLDLVLEVEVQGAAQLRERLAEAVFVFIVPPSMPVLEERLRGRQTEDEPVIRERLARARQEIQMVLGADGDAARLYDYVVTNDDLERAVSDLQHVIGACRVRRDRAVAACKARFGFA